MSTLTQSGHMSGMDTPATTRNKTISRSGLVSVAIGAAQCPASTRRSPESVLAAAAISADEKPSGGATDAPLRAAPSLGPAAVLLPQTPALGSSRRALDPARQ
jgi:hypothetical protein